MPQFGSHFHPGISGNMFFIIFLLPPRPLQWAWRRQSLPPRGKTQIRKLRLLILNGIANDLFRNWVWPYRSMCNKLIMSVTCQTWRCSPLTTFVLKTGFGTFWKITQRFWVVTQPMLQTISKPFGCCINRHIHLIKFSNTMDSTLRRLYPYSFMETRGEQ